MNLFLRLVLYAGVVVAAGIALRRLLVYWRRQRGSVSWGCIANDLGLEYREKVCQADLSTTKLRLFGQGIRGIHQLQGIFEGIEMQMFDLVPDLQRSGGFGAAHGTVVLLRIPGAPWPLFEIHPRGVALWLWVLLGCPGLRFGFRQRSLSSRGDRRVLQRFNRRYYVAAALTRRVAELAGLDAGIPLGNALLEERAIRDRFSLSALRRFGASPGWHGECCGTHVAFWRSSRVPPAQREPFLREAVELYRSLAAPPRSPADANVEVQVDDLDHAQLGRRLLGLISGGLLGMGLLMLISFPLLRILSPELIRWAVFLWPMLSLAALVIGAYAGARLVVRLG